MPLPPNPQNTPTNAQDFGSNAKSVTGLWVTLIFIGGHLFFFGLLGIVFGSNSSSFFKFAGLFLTIGWLIEQDDSGRWKSADARKRQGRG
jgi:flagellar biosynthesis component FlhA